MTAAPTAPVSSADFGTRFSAFAIDALLLFSSQWIIFIVLSRQLQAVGLTSTEPCVENGVAVCEGPNTGLWVLLLLLYVVTTVGYHAVFEGRYGATPGKRLMGLRVTDAGGQSPIGIAAGLLRSVVRQLFWLSPLFLFDVSPLSLGLPSVLFALVPALTVSVFVVGAFRSDGRAGHDLVAQTRVIGSETTTALFNESTTSASDLSEASSSSPSSDDNAAADEPENSV